MAWNRSELHSSRWAAEKYLGENLLKLSDRLSEVVGFSFSPISRTLLITADDLSLLF